MKLRIKLQDIWTDVEKIKANSPLVHNITNFVTMEQTANSLLAIGASPVMSHAIEEVEDMVNIAHSLVLNIGTLSPLWIDAMSIAVKAAKKKGIPVVLDPAGCGATPYRTNSALALIKGGPITVVKGNASEIAALSGERTLTKGVDSVLNPVDCIEKAKALALKYKCVVVVSGATDVITNGRRVALIHNGHFLMGKITGMGCIAAALMGAFLAVNPDPFLASIYTMSIMGIAGESAAQFCLGVGSFRTSFLDSLYNLSGTNIQKAFRIEFLPDSK